MEKKNLINWVEIDCIISIIDYLIDFQKIINQSRNINLYSVFVQKLKWIQVFVKSIDKMKLKMVSIILTLVVIFHVSRIFYLKK